MSEVSSWSTTAASNNSASPDGFPEAMAPSGVNDSARELMASIKRWRDDISCTVSAGGTGDVITVAAAQTISAYAAGQVFSFIATAANTGAVTLNVDSVGAKAIKKHHDVALSANDIESGQLVVVAYKATEDVFQMLSPTAAEHYRNVNTLTAAPGVGEDSADGYQPGSIAVDVTNDKAYICVDASAGAAIWSLASGGLEVIATGTETSVTEVQFTGLSASYAAYLFVLHNILPVTDNTSLVFNVSDDGGSTYETSFRIVRLSGSVAGSATVNGNNAASQIVLASGLGNSAAATQELKGVLWLHDPAGTADQTSAEWQIGHRNSSLDYTIITGAGHMTTTKAHNACKFYMTSGDFTSFSYTLYGLRTA